MAVNNVPFYGDDPFGVGQAPVTPDFGSFQTVGNGKLMVVVFVVDASRSMRGDRIAAVNAALTELMYELKQIQSDNGLDMKISIMTFTSDAKWVLQNVPVDEVLLRTIDTRVGLTNYGGAFKELNLVLTKDRFMAHTGKVAPPAIMFMTDGEPCDDYQHDLEILLKNGWFANANRSAVLIGDAINNPNARIAVEQFVENANEDIVTAEDSSTIVHRLKLATLHTVAGTPAVDGNTSAAKGGGGGQASASNPAGAASQNSRDPFLGGGNTGGSTDPFGDPFGDAASAGGNSAGGSSVDPFADPFGGAAASTGTSSSSGSSTDPFADPFADSFGAAAASTSTSSSSGSSADPFASAGGSSADPFVSAGGSSADPFVSAGGSSTDPFVSAGGNSADPFASAGGSDADPFGGVSGKGSGSADANSISSGSASSSNDPFASAGGSGADPFGGVSGKGSGSADASSTSSGSASSSNDPFASAGGSGADPFGGGGADPFGGSGGDPFGNGGGDPFGGGGDPFGGSDPFGGF